MKPIYLGINVGHDQAVAAVDAAGQLLYFAEEERFNRIRFSMCRPTTHAYRDLLRSTGHDESEIARAGVPFQPDRFDACVQRLCDGHQARDISTTPQIERMVDSYKLFSRQCRAVCHQFDLPADKVRFLSHHLCHAASAFFPSDHKRAAVLVIDGSGEDTSATIYHGHENKLDKLFQIELPHSLGLLWAHVTEWLGLGGLGHEGKTMGLAPYGRPTLVETFREHLIDWDDRGVYTNKTDVFLQCGRLEEVLGPGRLDEEALSDESADVAATLQHATEEIVVGLARLARELTGKAVLCYCGGVALNSVANGRIMAERVFDDYFFQPAANDAGAALGAALLLQMEDRPRATAARWVQKHLYFGSDIDEHEAQAALRHCGLPAERHPAPARWAAQRLVEGKVVGWARGRLEYGPRALGNRSILADPRQAKMKDVVNNRVKFREWWRPFAPSVPEELVGEYFTIDYPSPYMIQVYAARPQWLERMPAVCHVDNTCRVQTVSQEANPDYYELIGHFQSLTGIGCVLNTSFNVRGEPIVRTGTQAIEDFLRTDMDCLVVDAFVLDKATLDLSSVKEVGSFRPHLENVPASLEAMGDFGSLAVGLGIEEPGPRRRLLDAILSHLGDRSVDVEVFVPPAWGQKVADVIDVCKPWEAPVRCGSPRAALDGRAGLVIVPTMFNCSRTVVEFVEQFRCNFDRPNEVWIMDVSGIAVRYQLGRLLWGDLFLRGEQSAPATMPAIALIV